MLVSFMESRKVEIPSKHWTMSFKILNKPYISTLQKPRNYINRRFQHKNRER